MSLTSAFHFIDSKLFKGEAFSTPAPPLTITAHFRRMVMYSIQGVTLPDGGAPHLSLQIEGSSFSFGFSSDPNQLCQSLCGYDWVEDVSGWQKAHRSNGPYALIVLSLDEPQTATCTYVLENDECLAAYKCFEDAISLLDEYEEKVLPRIIGSAIASLSTLTDDPKIREIDRVTLGESQQYKHIRAFDIVGGQVELRVQRALRSELYSQTLDLIEKTAQYLPTTCAKFYWLGCNEQDLLKSYIYLFLALEVLIHKDFEGASGGDLKIKDLSKRFEFCATRHWIGISESDCRLFSKLKKIRNALAHGALEIPKQTELHQLRGLTDKVLRSVSLWN
ncbi:MAG: hypothetical protein O9309_17965 [Rhizobium sp.]|nr:hypothetical protein [Rhizobium sp.]MCZ8352694.1 hypothetical protein [Rhizobium sp.]